MSHYLEKFLKYTCLGILALCFLPAPVLAKTIKATPANYRQYLQQLQPGDTLLLQSGMYYSGLPVHHLLGTADKLITIRAEDKNRPPLFVARPHHNTISILDSAYVRIADLELNGRHLPVGGVKAEGHGHWAHHITLEGLVIRGHGNNQQTVAISTKCPTWGWVIRNNIIDAAGTGIYLGNSDGSDAFVGGLIEYNLITNTLGYNLQIKHQKIRESVAGMPTDRQTTIIRHNVFSKAKGNGQREMARPNVLVGHWPLSGAGQDDGYQIYANLFFQNPYEGLFQGEGNVALYNNVFVNELGDAVHIQPHNDVPRKIDVFYNTVLAAGTGIMIRKPVSDTGEELDVDFPQQVTANAVFAKVPIRAEQEAGNITAGFVAARDYLQQPENMDLRPVKRLQAKFKTRSMQDYPDWNLDFNGNPRLIFEVGAYTSDPGGKHWAPELKRKPW